MTNKWMDRKRQNGSKSQFWAKSTLGERLPIDSRLFAIQPHALQILREILHLRASLALRLNVSPG